MWVGGGKKGYVHFVVRRKVLASVSQVAPLPQYAYMKTLGVELPASVHAGHLVPLALSFEASSAVEGLAFLLLVVVVVKDHHHRRSRLLAPFVVPLTVLSTLC